MEMPTILALLSLGCNAKITMCSMLVQIRCSSSVICVAISTLLKEVCIPTIPVLDLCAEWVCSAMLIASVELLFLHASFETQSFSMRVVLSRRHSWASTSVRSRCARIAAIDL